MDAQKIMENNKEKLAEFFAGIASCNYYDGLSHQLYLDLDDGTIIENTEASDNTWLQRNDGSLVHILNVSGYCDIPEDERYTDGCDLYDYGYRDWLDDVATKINDLLNESTHA